MTRKHSFFKIGKWCLGPQNTQKNANSFKNYFRVLQINQSKSHISTTNSSENIAFITLFDLSYASELY